MQLIAWEPINISLAAADAHEDDAERAVRAGLALVEARFDGFVAKYMGDGVLVVAETVARAFRLSARALVIGADHGTHVLGVELGRERRRTNEVGEHRGELATLGIIFPSWLGVHGRGGCRYGNRDVAEIADRTEHLAAMAEQDTEVFQVLVCQIGENAGVDPVLHEASGVLGQAKRRQPLCDRRHNLGPRRIPATLYAKEAIQALFLVVVRVGVECARYREKGPTHTSDLLRVVKS
jgi:hypothetical protein